MKIKKILIYLFAVGAVVLLIKNASSAIRYASDAIDLCLEMIVPTLFPFFICSGILIYSGFCELLAKAFQFCMYPLFLDKSCREQCLYTRYCKRLSFRCCYRR